MACILLGSLWLFLSDLQRIVIIPSARSAAVACVEKAAPETPNASQDFSLSSLRRGAVMGRGAEKAPPTGLKRDLLCAAPDPGPASSRLDRCTEFTKPDSLCIRLMGTPKNHRSPPA